MPISKRSKEVALTQLRQKKFRGETGRAAKDLWKETVRAACEQKGQHVYLLEIHNQRNALLKHLRTLIKPGKLFYGKNRVMRLALGVDEATECLPNIHRIAKELQGCRCLLVCQQNYKQLKQLLRTQVHAKEFARAGFIATQDIELQVLLRACVRAAATTLLQEGEEALKDFPHSLEERFRSLGLPTVLKDGKIVLLGNYTVAKQGEPLTPEQAQMLKHLGTKLADFHVKILAEWHDGSFTLHEKH